MAGRKIRGVEVSTLARGAVTITGAGDTCVVFSLALGAEQIEQACRVALASSAWEWTACAVPMTKTMTMQSADTTTLHRPRFRRIPHMVLIH